MALTTTHDDPVSASIANDAFWGGNVEAGDWQEAYRLPSIEAPETFVRQLRLALIEVNRELATWREAREAEGQTVLTVEESELYLEALYAWAYSLLIPLLPSLYATDQADGLEDDQAGNEGRFRSRALGFLKRITGRAEPGEISMSVI